MLYSHSNVSIWLCFQVDIYLYIRRLDAKYCNIEIPLKEQGNGVSSFEQFSFIYHQIHKQLYMRKYYQVIKYTNHILGYLNEYEASIVLNTRTMLVLVFLASLKEEFPDFFTIVDQLSAFNRVAVYVQKGYECQTLRYTFACQCRWVLSLSRYTRSF